MQARGRGFDSRQEQRTLFSRYILFLNLFIVLLLAKRRPNFTDSEKEILVEEVNKKQMLLFGIFSNKITKDGKEALWEDIAAKVCGHRE